MTGEEKFRVSDIEVWETVFLKKKDVCLGMIIFYF